MQSSKYFTVLVLQRAVDRFIKLFYTLPVVLYMSETGEGGAIVVFLFISNPCRGSTGKAEDFSPLKLRGKPTTEIPVHVLKSKRRALGGGNSLKARCGVGSADCMHQCLSTLALDTRSRTFSLIYHSQDPRDLPKTPPNIQSVSRALFAFIYCSRLCNIRSCFSCHTRLIPVHASWTV